MAETGLERPATPADLYLAPSRDEVDAGRPVLTGDIFENIVLPRIAGASLRLVLMRPCLMRTDGVKLAK